MDRLATRKDPLNRQESYNYDLNGNLTTFTDRKQQVSTFLYDAVNRRVSAVFADGSSTSFTYDAVGRLAAVSDSISGTIQFSYDMLDRLILEVTPQGAVAYEYDALGRRTKMTVSGLAPVTYQYDAASRLTQVAWGSFVVTIGYDVAGRRTTLTYSNGATTTYGYDAASRLTFITHSGPLGLIESLTYAYDAAGNRILLNRANGPAILLSDPVQATYDAANQLIQFNGNPVTHDANGNLTSDWTTTYTWDARNRLIGMTGDSPPSAPGTVPLSATFQYDALGRRISKTINGQTTQFLYDGNDIIAEMQGGAITAFYLRGLNIDEPFVRITPTGNEYYHQDALGSTLALTNDSGAVTTTYSYEPFGKTAITGTSTNPFQYTGRENDGTGLYYYRARYYSHNLQRFISEDPLGLAGGDVNPYSYVLSNPLIYIDPLGLNVKVAYYPPSSNSPGHIGIGVNTNPTVGFYPAGTDFTTDYWIALGLPVAGAVLPDSSRQGRNPKDVHILKTTPDQDRAIQAAIDAITKKPGDYLISGANCVTFASDVLGAGGIIVQSPIIAPWTFNQNICNYAKCIK